MYDGEMFSGYTPPKELVLRPIQTDIVNQLRETFKIYKRVILMCGTGVGKTIMATHIIKIAKDKGKRCVFINDRVSLVCQTSAVFDEYGVNHGVIMSDHPQYFPDRDVQVASAQTLARRDVPNFDLIVIDECFTGDTKITTPMGEKQIKLLKVGDLVYNGCGCGVIEKVFKGQSKTITIGLSNGKKIKCTEGHPFFTNTGWKKARELDGGERLFSKKDMPSLWAGVPPRDSCFGEWKEKGRGVGKTMGKSENLLKILLKEVKQPNAQPGIKKKNGCVKKEERHALHSEAGWKWSANSATKKITCGIGGRVGGRIYSTHKSKDLGWGEIASSFKNRYCEQGQDDCDRDRRSFSQSAGKATAGCDKRCCPKIVRVESVEVEKSGSIHNVYNIQVSRHPSYFAEGVLVHNCHTWYKSHEKILKQNPEAYVIGLSATPFSKGLGKHFDCHIEPYKVRELIKQGLLCDFEIYGPAIYDLSKVKTVAGDYDKKGLANATDQKHLIADVVQTYKKLGNGRKTICFCTNVAHGRHLAREFTKNGIKAVEVNAYQIPEETRDNMRLFCDGEVDVICSVEILIKGFDLTSVDCVLWATATKSAMKWIQGSGRGLRIHPGKTLCRIIDHGGNCERLGFPDEYEFLKLDDGKHKDSKSKDKERPEQLPKKCPSCDFLKAPGVMKCPACGVIPKFIKDVETTEGELKKLQRKTNKTYTKAEKQSFLNQLNGYCRDKGCNIGTASHKYKEKFGVWPNKMEKGIYEPVGEDVKKFIQHSNIKFAKSKSTHSKNDVSDKNNHFKSKVVKQEPLHGRLIRLNTPCKCGNKAGSLYPKGPHWGVRCAMCDTWLKWINQDDARLKLI